MKIQICLKWKYTYLRGCVSECMYIYIYMYCKWLWWQQEIKDIWYGKGKKTNLGGRKVLLLLEARGRRQWKREGKEASKYEFLQNWRYLSLQGTMFRVSISLFLLLWDRKRWKRKRDLGFYGLVPLLFVFSWIYHSWSHKYMNITSRTSIN